MWHRVIHDPLELPWHVYRRARPAWRLGDVNVGVHLVRFPDPDDVSRYDEASLGRLLQDAEYVTLRWSDAVQARSLLVAVFAIGVTVAFFMFERDVGPYASLGLTIAVTVALAAIVYALAYSMWRVSRLHVLQLFVTSYEKELSHMLRNDPRRQVEAQAPGRFWPALAAVGTAILLTTVWRRRERSCPGQPSARSRQRKTRTHSTKPRMVQAPRTRATFSSSKEPAAS